MLDTIKKKISIYPQTVPVIGVVLFTAAIGMRLDWFVGGAFFAVTLFILCALLFLYTHSNRTSKHIDPRSAHIQWIVSIVVIIILGVITRGASLAAFPLQGDEYFHVNTGMGYLQTGEYVQWDFLAEEPDYTKVYTRAWPYTWQVAQSIRFFGTEEWALRLPSFVWSIVFLGLLPLVIYYWTREWGIAFVVTALAAFDHTLIWQAGFSRMYSMLFVCVLLSSVAAWKALQPNQYNSHMKRWLWLAIAFACVGCTFIIHDVALLLCASWGVYVVYAAIRYSNERWYRQVLIFGAIVGIIGSASAVVGVIDLSEYIDFITVRTQAQWRYAHYPFAALPVTAMAVVCVITGLLAFRSKKGSLLMQFAYITSAPIFIYFIFFADRYAARKYIAFILFFVWMLIGYGWNTLWERSLSPWLQLLLIIALLIPVSIPSYSGVILKEDRSDKTIQELDYHDYPAVYAMIEAEAGQEEAVIMTGIKEYYMTRADIDYYGTSPQNRMTVEELKGIVDTYEHGWIVLSRVRSHLLADEFKEYVQSEFELYSKGKEINFRVYRW